MTADHLVVRSEVALTADPTRVLAKLFVPGHELSPDTRSRSSDVLSRILALPEETVVATLADVQTRYAHRHRHFAGVLERHYAAVAHRIPHGTVLSAHRRALLGAWFTNEYSLAGSALFNPSAVPHPDQSGLAAGELRFVLSLRAAGEGHISSIEFRSGVLGPGQRVRIDDPVGTVEAGTVGATTYDRQVFAAKLAEEGSDAESEWYLVGELPQRFGDADLERALVALEGQQLTRQGHTRTAELARRIASSTYEVRFAPQTALDQRVLWPHGPTETHGMEDARFVRCTDGTGATTYRATYTAFDGRDIAPQLLETTDFTCFRVSPLAGPAAKNKGLALFPRTIGGTHFALSRWDRENCAVASSKDGVWWAGGSTIHAPQHPWELIQTGNCGSPLETEAGWLVLTHGVGPMREYAIGALLLDLADPTRVVASLDVPLVAPAPDEREGYVPNVVYSCGALLHGDQLLLPYGASDDSVRFAFVDVPRLLDRMRRTG